MSKRKQLNVWKSAKKNQLDETRENKFVRGLRRTPSMFWVKKYKTLKKPSIKQRKNERQKAGNRKKGTQEELQSCKNKMCQ